MRVQLKLGVASALDHLGVLERLRRLRPSLALVLTFHRVLLDAEIGTCYERHIAMCASTFEALLRLLRAEYEVVSLEQLLALRHTGGARRVALTFDDGWEDTCSVVAPMLKSFAMPATVFLCPALMSGGPGSMLPEERFARVWQAAHQQARLPQLLRDLETWRVAEGLGQHLHAWARRLKQLPLDLKLMMLEHLEHIYTAAAPAGRRFLTWDEARGMQAQGIDFGSHTARHASLDAEDPATMRRELLDSRERIAAETRQPCTMLAYPNGAYNAQVVLAAQQAGYSYAFTTDGGFVGSGTDPLAIPRLSMADPVVDDLRGGLHASRTRLYLSQLGVRRRVALSGQQLGQLQPHCCAPCAAAAAAAEPSAGAGAVAAAQLTNAHDAGVPELPAATPLGQAPGERLSRPAPEQPPLRAASPPPSGEPVPTSMPFSSSS